MKLSDKPCYPTMDDVAGEFWEGLTFRERLIIALAGNPMMIDMFGDKCAERIITHADAIIKELENEK